MIDCVEELNRNGAMNMNAYQLERAKLHTLRQLDAKHGESYVREIEMAADVALTTPNYSVQFWRDVAVYGMREAILYVRNGDYGDADAILAKWDDVQKRIRANGC
jgi:hypothetical protein